MNAPPDAPPCGFAGELCLRRSQGAYMYSFLLFEFLCFFLKLRDEDSFKIMCLLYCFDNVNIMRIIITSLFWASEQAEYIWSFGLSVGRSVGWSVGLSVCRSVCRSVGRSVCRSVGRSVGRSGRVGRVGSVGSVGSGRVGSGRSVGRSGRVGSGRVGSGRIGSGRVGRVGSGRVGSGRVGSGRVGSGRVGRSSRVGSVSFMIILDTFKFISRQQSLRDIRINGFGRMCAPACSRDDHFVQVIYDY